MEFLDEIEVLGAARELLSKADRATLVVAFWGKGAIEKLGLEKKWEALQIVCNLDSGACNPQVIKALMSLPNVSVLNDRRLHGKVYLTDKAVILGSSNASGNGLVVEGDGLFGWAEANIQSSDPALIARARAWCDQRLGAAKEIEKVDLQRAEKAWNVRRKMAPLRGGRTTDLLKAVRRDPGHSAWAGVKLVIWSEYASPAAEKQYRLARRANKLLAGTDYYEGWKDKLAPGDWLIDFQAESSRAAFTGYWNVLDLPKTSADLTIVREVDAIAPTGIGRFKLSEEDQLATGELAQDLLRAFPGPERGATVLGVVELAKFLGQAAPSVADLEDAFEKAMYKIYDDAKEAGHIANRFREMVDREGGRAAASILIAQSPSSGFTALWELGRLDLTVEALVIQSRWKPLFSEAQQAQALRMLKLHGWPKLGRVQNGFPAAG